MELIVWKSPWPMLGFRLGQRAASSVSMDALWGFSGDAAQRHHAGNEPTGSGSSVCHCSWILRLCDEPLGT